MLTNTLSHVDTHRHTVSQVRGAGTWRSHTQALLGNVVVERREGERMSDVPRRESCNQSDTIVDFYACMQQQSIRPSELITHLTKVGCIGTLNTRT